MRIRRWWLILPASAALWLPGTAAAQDFDARVYGLAASNAEVDRLREARGLGVGADVGVALGRWRLQVRGSTASLHADFAIQPDYAVNELAVLGSYRWRPALTLQLGAARRFTRPDFAAQEVGLLKVGLLVETHLSSLARRHRSRLCGQRPPRDNPPRPMAPRMVPRWRRWPRIRQRDFMCRRARFRR